MVVPIPTDMFNRWFAQGAIPGSITKGVISLLKKGGRHVWEDLDDYRPITLLNTELKILAWVLANRLQLVISDLIGPEMNYAVKWRSIQGCLHLVREILEGFKDATEAALINLDQSKALDRVDYRFLLTVMETAGFKPEFCKWISMWYHMSPAVVQVNGKRLEAFAIDLSVRQGCPMSPLLLLWSPFSVSLGMRKLIRPCMNSPSPSVLGWRSAYADDITVFMSLRLDIQAVKKTLERYEEVADAKISFD